MRRELPINDVDVPYITILDEIICKVSNISEAKVASIFITGSYARGDAKNISDFDIWVILEDINFDILNQLGLHVREISNKYNVIINPQCLSRNELKKSYFDNWTEASVKVLDAVILFGEDIFEHEVSVLELEQMYKKYIVDVLMGVRHYITVDKPMEKLTYKRLETYIFKPLLFPLRMERYCTTGKYPINKKDLYESYSNSMKEVIEYSLNKKKFEDEIKRDHKAVLRKIYKAVDGLLEVDGTN